MSVNRNKPAPRLAQPAIRYWKGKAPKGVEDVASESEDEAPETEEVGDVPMGGDQDIEEESEEDDNGGRIAPLQPRKPIKSMNLALKDVNISTDGKVTVAGRDESGRTAVEQQEESEEESDEEPGAPKGDGSSSEYESDSEEEAPKPQFRPMFVSKKARVAIPKPAEDVNSEEAMQKRQREAEERKKQSHDLVAETIRRELAEKEKEEVIPDVDDTDGLDPSAEFEAWRLRELGRIKKEKEDEVRREEERAEVERRRALPEEQRLREDLANAEKLRAEKPKGSQQFLQKYWHKGAFHQDEEILQRHDFTEGTESTVDVSSLPSVMQVKNFGKRSRTKYTHLVDQDTTNVNQSNTSKPGMPPNGAGCFLCGGPHMKRDCPQNAGGPPGAGGAMGFPTGSNSTATGSRAWGGAPPDSRSDVSSWKDPGKRADDRVARRGDDNEEEFRQRRGDEYRDRRDKYDSRMPPPRRSMSPPRGHARSRSPRRSPPPKTKSTRWDEKSRRRSRSRERPDDKESKRRRLD